eukprot:6678610-Prymnesium_polylepis.1
MDGRRRRGAGVDGRRPRVGQYAGLAALELLRPPSLKQSRHAAAPAGERRRRAGRRGLGRERLVAGQGRSRQRVPAGRRRHERRAGRRDYLGCRVGLMSEGAGGSERPGAQGLDAFA